MPRSPAQIYQHFSEICSLCTSILKMDSTDHTSEGSTLLSHNIGTSNFTSHFHLNPFMMDAIHSHSTENAILSQMLYQYDFSCKLSG